jgi:hypothetical protein
MAIRLIFPLPTGTGSKSTSSGSSAASNSDDIGTTIEFREHPYY